MNNFAILLLQVHLLSVSNDIYCNILTSLTHVQHHLLALESLECDLVKSPSVVMIDCDALIMMQCLHRRTTSPRHTLESYKDEGNHVHDVKASTP